MQKFLLSTIDDLYILLDEVYNIIPKDDVNKAVYNSKEEQYEYQLSEFKQPPSFPCVMVYDTKRYHYNNYRKPHLYNKDYHFIIGATYVTLDDFK